MNDELTTQAAPAPIVLKLKKYDDIILPHTSRLSTDTLNDNSSSSFIQINEAPVITTVSPPTLRVKLKKPFINGTEDDEYINSTDGTPRPAKRSKKSSSNDHLSELNNEPISSQIEMNELNQEQLSNSPLVVKIRRDSLTSTLGTPTTVETDNNRQLLLKLKKNEYGELTTSAIPNETPSNNTEYVNGHNNSFHSPTKQENQAPIQPHITNMLSSLNDDKQWNNHVSQPQPTTTVSHVPMDVTPAPSTSSATAAADNHTKELLDEALDSVKNVLMQTFKKNLESGGDLNALKNTLGSDEVAEVFLSKLRESLKRETISTIENEQKSQDTEIRSSPSLNTIISPIMNVVSPSPSASSPLPSISTIITKNTSPIPSSASSPQTPTTPTVTNKRKSSNPATNPNRFDGTTEEELAKRLLSDILQPNLDIVFVGINPSLYAVHKGHHYGGPGNHFWKLLHMSDLIPNAFTAEDDFRMPQYGIGFTNIVQRPTKAGSDITKDEITAGAEVLMQKIKTYRPKIVAFNGRGIYEVYAGNKHFHYGKQPDLFLGTDTHVFVMPSSSARCSQLPRAEDKLPFYVGLRKLRDFVNGTLYSLNEAEITFPDIKIKDTDDVLQKTIIRISNKPFSELSPETLKTFGDKIPSGQMTSKYHSDTITTQTMSILTNQQNDNLFTKTSSIKMNDTDAAVLAALANGAGGLSSSQTIYVGRQPQQLKGLNSSSSHTIHHLPQPSSSTDLQIPSVSLLSSSSSSLSNSQIVVLNPNERPSISLKDLLSSQQPAPKQTFIVPTNPTNTSSKSAKLVNNTADDSLYLRYEREQPSTQNSFHFSYIIDEYSSSIHKRLRYVSINDL